MTAYLFKDLTARAQAAAIKNYYKDIMEECGYSPDDNDLLTAITLGYLTGAGWLFTEHGERIA